MSFTRNARMKFALAAMMALVPAASFSQNTDGNSLYYACNDEGLSMQGFCIGFIIGAIEGTRFGLAYPLMAEGGRDATEINEMSNILLSNCPPADIQNGQYIDIVKQYLMDNPASRHESARGLILLAIQKAYPCKAWEAAPSVRAPDANSVPP